MFLKTKKYKHNIQGIMRFVETLPGHFFMKFNPFSQKYTRLTILAP